MTDLGFSLVFVGLLLDLGGSGASVGDTEAAAAEVAFAAATRLEFEDDDWVV